MEGLLMDDFSMEAMTTGGHVVGIDADVHRIAWAHVHGGAVCNVGQFERSNSKGRMDDRYVSQLMGLMSCAQEFGAAVWLEGIYLPDKGASPRRNVEGFRRLAGVQGEIQFAGFMKAIPVYSVQPAKWMSELLGRKKYQGNTKTLSMDWAQRYWGASMTTHEADAVCIALWAWQAAREMDALFLNQN